VCLVTVVSLQQWADKIVSVVKTRFSSNIMTVDEIYSGEDAHGTGVLYCSDSKTLVKDSRYCKALLV
jgi:hypothetical protein